MSEILEIQRLLILWRNSSLKHKTASYEQTKSLLKQKLRRAICYINIPTIEAAKLRPSFLQGYIHSNSSNLTMQLRKCYWFLHATVHVPAFCYFVYFGIQMYFLSHIVFIINQSVAVCLVLRLLRSGLHTIKGSRVQSIQKINSRIAYRLGWYAHKKNSLVKFQSLKFTTTVIHKSRL